MEHCPLIFRQDNESKCRNKGTQKATKRVKDDAMTEKLLAKKVKRGK